MDIVEPWKDYHMEGGCQKSDWKLEKDDSGDWWWTSSFHPSVFIGKDLPKEISIIKNMEEIICQKVRLRQRLDSIYKLIKAKEGEV